MIDSVWMVVWSCLVDELHDKGMVLLIFEVICYLVLGFDFCVDVGLISYFFGCSQVSLYSCLSLIKCVVYLVLI